MTPQNLEIAIREAHERGANQLDLSRQRISSLPGSIGSLAELQQLLLNGNRLTLIPDSIGRLNGLTELFLHDNELVELPTSLLHLAKRGMLRVLFLHGNDALGIPPEILGPAWTECIAYHPRGLKEPARPVEILEYYFRTRGDTAKPLNEAKLILIGRGEAGKTCVANRLVHNIFKDTSKTDGIQITQWPLKLGRDGVRLHVWDFGGQEIMHATHQFFLTQRSLYLLVLAGRAGGEDTEAEYWLQLVESFAGESPVIVVLNKISEHPFDLNRRALRQKYPSIREFVRIDCKDGQGLDELHAAIRREVDRLDGLRTKFPGPWFKIKDYLASMAERGENFLSYEDYAQLCAKHGETDAAAQSQLAGYLHSLGIALNFKDDPRLQDTHVLSPHWVTNGIYKILNWPELEARKGIMKRADLMGLLDNKAYPRDKHGFLLDLMKKFDTCFEFPDDRECRFFVPELLDKQEPVQTGQFDCADTLEFEYHYNYIPEGLLPRFIVRTHALSEGRPRWRTGVILKFEENEAMVKADTQARKVHISVAGKHEGRRRLLAVIRSDFERIHNDIKKLEVTEMVPVPGRSDECVSYVELCVFEQKNVRKMPRVIGTEIVKLDVKALLNGVDIEGSRRRPALQTAESPVRIFISYSHKDENLRAELETHLKLLQRENKIATWTDRRILGGGRWAKEISRNLELADMILLLVSSDFVASDYCYDNEMKRAIARGNANNVTLIPIIVRACDWKSAPFGSFQGFPENGRAVTLWEDRDNAWTDVVLGIRRAIDTRPKVGWRSRKLRERGE